MVTEEFHNKEYEEIVHNLKTTLLKIVLDEQNKINEAERITVQEDNSSSRAEVYRLCDEERKCLRDTIEVIDNLSSSLQQLDSYSDNITNLLRENGIDLAMLQQEEAAVPNMAMEESPVEEVVEVDTVASPEANEVVDTPSEEVAPAEEVVEGDTVASPEADEVVDTPSEEVAPAEEVVEGDTATSPETNEVVNTPSEEVAPAEEVVEGDTVTSPETNEVVDTPSEEIAPAEEVVSNSETVSEPVIAIEEESSQIPAPIDETLNVSDLPLVSEVSDLDNKVIPEANIPLDVFEKNTSDAPKAIITTKAQTDKLRKSYEEQVLLFQTSLQETPLVANQDQNLEQQLVQNGLLPTDSADKQKQLEEMMIAAQELYKAGKMEEAQAMYAKVSALNQEITGDNAVQKAA